MNLNLIIPLAAFTLCLLLAAIVISRNYKNNTHRLFAVFLTSMALWGIFTFALRASSDEQHALLWSKSMMVIVLIASVAFLHFSFLYTRIKRGRRVLPLFYMEFIIFLFLYPTDLVIKSIGLDAYGYFPVAGPLLYSITLSSYTFFIWGLKNFLTGYRLSVSYEERNAFIYMIAGTVSFLLGGIVDILSLLGAPIPPVALVGNIIFCLLTTIAILKYHLLDMNIVLRKGTTYLLVSACVAIPYVGAILLAGKIFATNFLLPWIYFLVLLFLAFIMQPIWIRVQHMVDKLFYQERYDQLKALEEFSHQTHAVNDLEKLSSSLVSLINASLRCKGVYLLLPRTRKDDFLLASGIPTSNLPVKISLANNSPITRRLTNYDEFLYRTDIDFMPKLLASSSAEVETLRKLDIELLLPLKTSSGLAGIILLGPKQSKQVYSREDRNILTIVTRHMAATFDNVLLYEELKQAYGDLHIAQDQLVQVEKLKALGTMTSGIAHDFNNILTAILGRAQLALLDLKEGKAKQDIEIVIKAAMDAAAMVRRMQDFARVRTDRTLDVVDLNEVVKSALDMVKPRLDEQCQTLGARIESIVRPGKNSPVEGSASELREAMVSMLINAIDAMPGGGKLTITTSQENDSAIVAISDTGTGMTNEVKQRIFDPFFTTKGPKGLGMGLAVVYGIINRHGGQISVSSELNKGSTFTIRIPVSRKTIAREARTAASPSPGNHQGKILIVDDDQGPREVLHKILAVEGYRADVADCGKDGLSLALQNNYNLVLADLGMPDISGIDLAREIKNSCPLTQVILVTGWGVQLDRSDLKQQGICDVIAKPFTREDIIKTIGSVLLKQTFI